MRNGNRPETDFHALLERVEAASPTQAIDVVPDELAAAVGAQAVRFLIADFSGRALVRFGPPAPGEPGARRHGDEEGQTLPLSGTVYERVLRTQRIDVRTLEDGVHLTVPVTGRGDAIGVIELTLPRHPDAVTDTRIVLACCPSCGDSNVASGTKGTFVTASHPAPVGTINVATRPR
jgi:hypothetical protein